MAESNRPHYPLIAAHPELSYWDTAATTPPSRAVIEELRLWVEREHTNVHRGQYDLANKGTLHFERVREQTRTWLNTPTGWSITFNSGATAGLNTVAAGLDDQISEGDAIVVTADAHHSLFVPLQQLARRRQAKLTVIGVDESGQLDGEAWGEAIARRPKIVALPHASNVTGQIHDISILGAQAQAVGALVMVDGAQAISHLPINLAELPTDAYVFSAHKMYGPTGVGVLALSPRLSELITPSIFGGGMIDRVDIEDSSWAPLPAKLEAGTPNIWGIASFGAAITWLENHREKLAANDALITELLLDRLPSIPNLKIYGPTTTANRLPLVSFTVAGLHAHDIAEVMGQQQVAVRAGHHCAQPLHRGWDVPATVRASAGLFTTAEDVDRLIDALKTAITTLNHGR